jgi:hypothetical protein
VARPRFETLLDELETVELTVTPDRDVIWEAFAGWRMNYDRSIAGLRELVGDVPSHWERQMFRHHRPN